MPLFSLVTGPDFGRSHAWARKQPRLRTLLMKPKIIQRAFFAAGAGGHTEATSFCDSYDNPHSSHPVIRPAIIEIAGLQFSSMTPATAAQAEKINNVVEEVCK